MNPEEEQQQQEETTQTEPKVFNWVASQGGTKEAQKGPVSLVYTPNGWEIKKS
jgi:hypothetical protein